MDKNPALRTRLWLGRFLIGVVLFFNIQCGVLFIANPEAYQPGFELQGDPGRGIIQGMGVLFLMWNIPYLVACAHPVKFRISLFEAVAMQTVGLAGETVLLWSLQGDHPVLRQSVTRFIVFDSLGLIVLLLAALAVLPLLKSNPLGGIPNVLHTGQPANPLPPSK